MKMAITIVKNPAQRKQRRILSTLRSLSSLPKVDVSTSESVDGSVPNIQIRHAQEYVPDFHLVWSPTKEHYRVYIHVADTMHQKVNAGYCICVIPTPLAASSFVILYSFLHKHRANNKSSAE
jgi:hypothetical protein